jgi:hypothetical protein
MTTAKSPLRVLKAQADKIAATLKAAARGDKIDVQFAEKIEAARGKPSIIFGIAMDDKLLKIQIPWTRVQETSEVALSEWILDQMRDARGTPQ